VLQFHLLIHTPDGGVSLGIVSARDVAQLNPTNQNILNTQLTTLVRDIFPRNQSSVIGRTNGPQYYNRLLRILAEVGLEVRFGFGDNSTLRDRDNGGRPLGSRLEDSLRYQRSFEALIGGPAKEWSAVLETLFQLIRFQGIRLTNQ
jgi:hypothetical protein